MKDLNLDNKAIFKRFLNDIEAPKNSISNNLKLKRKSNIKYDSQPNSKKLLKTNKPRMEHISEDQFIVHKDLRNIPNHSTVDIIPEISLAVNNKKSCDPADCINYKANIDDYKMITSDSKKISFDLKDHNNYFRKKSNDDLVKEKVISESINDLSIVSKPEITMQMLTNAKDMINQNITNEPEITRQMLTDNKDKNNQNMNQNPEDIEYKFSDTEDENYYDENITGKQGLAEDKKQIVAMDERNIKQNQNNSKMGDNEDSSSENPSKKKKNENLKNNVKKSNNSSSDFIPTISLICISMLMLIN